MKKILLTLLAVLCLGAVTSAQNLQNVIGKYHGDLYIQLEDPIDDTTEPIKGQSIDILASENGGKVDFAIYNFGFSGLSLGDILLPAISINEGETVTFAENPKVSLSFLGSDIMATANLDHTTSYIKGDSIYADINVSWLMDKTTEVPIYVRFVGAKPSLYALFNGNFNGDWEECSPWDSQNGFFDWGSLEDDAWQIMNFTRDQMVQPKGWVISNVTGLNGLGATLVGKADTLSAGDYAVTLSNNPNPFMSTQIVPGYMSLGTTWATANAMDLAGTADGGAYGGVKFVGRPDALTLRYKRSHGTANPTERASVVAYLWKGTYTQASVPGNTGFGTTVSVDMIDRDRNILGKETTVGGEVTKTDDAACLAVVEKYIEGDAAEWTELTAEFDYADFAGTDVRPEKLNIVISANDYFADRSLMGQGNSITVDDVKLVYWHALSSLSYEGASIKFDEATTEYDLSDLSYNAAKLSYTKKGQGATVTTAYDEETGRLTISVKADDISVNPKNVTDYVLQFSTVSAGVENVTTASPATSGVYTLSGVRVADKDDASLPKGVYIINGKKIVK